MPTQGYLALVLHAHLPFVRHPEQDDFLEERWFFEALTETYLPLLQRLQHLANDGIPPRITISFSPTLLAMLADELLRAKYLRHLDRLIELAEKEMWRTRWEPPFHRLALMYHHRFTQARQLYADACRGDLIQAFGQLADRRQIELMTCGATHGYLPLMDPVRIAVRAQVRVAVESFTQHFGRPPRGLWLPECGYNPGDDAALKQHGIRFFFTDAHGVLFASPRPKFGVYAPIYCTSGVACFGRDLESSKSVWSAEEGYPSDYDYREFYRDVGYDLAHDYIRPYINGDGTRVNTGIKYYRITGPTDDKQPYNPDRALDKAAEHAGNFLFNRTKQVEYLASIMQRPPIIVSPYDAELFGHWWFEGPDWLELLIRKTACDQQVVELTTPTMFLEQFPRHQVSQPAASSWGWQGYHEVWLNGANDWMYRHLHQAVERMQEVARAHPQASGLVARALNQMARELLLAQSSDWAFIMKTGTFVGYAERRFKEHLGRFTRLYDAVQHCRAVDEGDLRTIEQQDNLFPTMDYRVYADA